MTREVRWFLVFWVFASSLPQHSGPGPCPRDSFLEVDAWAPRCLVWTWGGRAHLAALFPECRPVVQLAARTGSGPWASSGSASGASLVGNRSGFVPSICTSFLQLFRTFLMISGPPAVFGLVCQHPLEILKISFYERWRFEIGGQAASLSSLPRVSHMCPPGHVSLLFAIPGVFGRPGATHMKNLQSYPKTIIFFSQFFFHHSEFKERKPQCLLRWECF